MIAASLFLLLFVVTAAAVLIDRTRTEAARLRLLVELSERLQLSTGITEATEILPPFARRLFPRLEGALYVGGAVNGVVELAVSWGDAREAQLLDISDCSALRSRMTRLAYAGAPPLCRHADAVPDAELICVPMLASGEPFGLLMLRSAAGTPLPHHIERLANPFAHQIALALSNLRLQETLRAAAVRDSLTGLYNRRCLEESVTLELLGAAAGDPDARVGVILVDADHFKRFNDTWGHGGGDALLQHLARLMQGIFGDDNIVCRWGGEEFLVVMPNVTLDDVRTRAEHLRQRVRDLCVETEGQVLGNVTVSAGIAISPDHATTLEGLVAAADRALYAAKSAGRDRVCAPPPQIVGRDAAA
jgi:diguanylate cyclase (GGDEF)-like protein